MAATQLQRVKYRGTLPDLIMSSPFQSFTTTIELGMQCAMPLLSLRDGLEPILVCIQN